MPKINNKSENNKNKGKFNPTWIYVGVLAFVFFSILTNNEEATVKINYTKFQECIDSGYVANIRIDKTEQELFFNFKPDSVQAASKHLPKEAMGKAVLVSNYPSVDKLEDFLERKRVVNKFLGEVKYENGGAGFWSVFLQFVFPFLIIILFWIIIMRRMGGGSGGGVFSFGKSRAKLFEGGNMKDKITFKDVAGLAGAKQEVQEVVDFLRNPQKYTELGGKIPKGVLLVGPPGTGKTLLAKAVAGEANVSFFSLSGSDFVEMFVGVGASRVRDLFMQAKAKSPAIVFIDEIDAIGRARSGKASIQANDERESTLNQLLTEMDGFGANAGVIVMAATNRADILDKALLRAGRFDRQINVELPDLKERQQIFNVHLKPIKIDESVDVEQLARQTPGLSGADIANVCNEAALIAARNRLGWVNKQCFLDAVDRVLGGLEKKTKVMTEAEKRTIAIHEAGHATISWFLQHTNPLVKVTIVPRGNALGANWYMPEERPVTTKEELLDQICGLLGGRAAEELFTGHICTGASNDLQRVTSMVYSMISIYGMGEKMPNVNYYDFAENSFTKPYSDYTAQLMDEEVKSIIEGEYDRAKRVIMQHSKGLQELAQRLIDKEVIYPADLEEIFGKRQWKSRSDEIMELNKNLTIDNASQDGEQNFNDENEEIIRQKAIAAVLEKQKKQNSQDEQKEETTNNTDKKSSSPVWDIFTNIFKTSKPTDNTNADNEKVKNIPQASENQTVNETQGSYVNNQPDQQTADKMNDIIVEIEHKQQDETGEDLNKKNENISLNEKYKEDNSVSESQSDDYNPIFDSWSSQSITTPVNEDANMQVNVETEPELFNEEAEDNDVDEVINYNLSEQNNVEANIEEVETEIKETEDIEPEVVGTKIDDTDDIETKVVEPKVVEPVSEDSEIETEPSVSVKLKQSNKTVVEPMLFDDEDDHEGEYVSVTEDNDNDIDFIEVIPEDDLDDVDDDRLIDDEDEK